jgi:hypothetical protein
MHDLAQFVSELTLEWSHNFDDSRSERDELQVLDSLRPHQSLEKLSLLQQTVARYFLHG